MKTVIMAGGKGTRISSVASDIPKPMIKIAGMPVLEHEIKCLREQGFTDIILTINHLGNIIIDYFGDGSKISPVTGSPFGVHIDYYIEKEPLGNAGALFRLKEKLTDDFLLLNADIMFDINLNRFVQYHKQKGGVLTLFAHPNDHPYDSSLIATDKEQRIISWLSKEEKRPKYYQNLVNAGLHVVSSKVLDMDVSAHKVDLDADVLKTLAGTGKLYAYISPEYVKDMGTPERYEAVCRDFCTGKMNSRNLYKKQKAFFLDRDGVINQHVGFLRSTEDFVLLPGVAKAIRTINKSEYLAIVVTNQPVIARGEVSIEELEMIHHKMETLLGQEGAYLDGIYYCPHHPQKGFPGERVVYKINCNCRKPNPGMLLQAADDFNIDLLQSWMIGDSRNDIEAGIRAGCQTVMLGGMKDCHATLELESLMDLVDFMFHKSLH